MTMPDANLFVDRQAKEVLNGRIKTLVTGDGVEDTVIGPFD